MFQQVVLFPRKLKKSKTGASIYVSLDYLWTADALRNAASLIAQSAVLSRQVISKQFIPKRNNITFTHKIL